MPAASAEVSVVKARPVPAIVSGGLIAGALDISYAILRTYQLGGSPARMLKGIAAGLLGRDVIQGGWEYAALGLGLHFTIALGVAVTYWAASRKLSFLITYAVFTGPLFGALVYLFMNRVVLPLSALSSSPPLQLPGLLAVMFLVGLPIALAARQFTK